MLREHQWGLVCPSRIKPHHAELKIFFGPKLPWSQSRTRRVRRSSRRAARLHPRVYDLHMLRYMYSIELYCRNPCSSRGRVPVGTASADGRRDAGARQSKCAFSSVTCSGSQISSSADMSYWEMLSVSTRSSHEHALELDGAQLQDVDVVERSARSRTRRWSSSCRYNEPTLATNGSTSNALIA